MFGVCDFLRPLCHTILAQVSSRRVGSPLPAHSFPPWASLCQGHLRTWWNIKSLGIMVSTNMSTISWHSLQRIELLPLPWSVTGLDVLQMNRRMKKRRHVASILSWRACCFLLPLLWVTRSGETSCHVMRTLKQIHGARNGSLQSAPAWGRPLGSRLSSPSPPFRWVQS